MLRGLPVCGVVWPLPDQSAVRSGGGLNWRHHTYQRYKTVQSCWAVQPLRSQMLDPEPAEIFVVPFAFSVITARVIVAARRGPTSWDGMQAVARA